MNPERTRRKLVAILSADVKGYSRLMEDDEEATVRTITAYREIMTNQIRQENGRVVDAKGDNLLAEFPSVVDAVRCSVEIQKELKTRNAELPEQRRMEFRIGINLGDVIEEEGTIYGDGVNIAARLEGVADGGGICISGTAFDQVKKKLNVGYEYLGEHSVKNIADPVRVYKILMELKYAGEVIGEERPIPKKWRVTTIAAAALFIVLAGALLVWKFYFKPPPIEPASVERMAFPLPEKPSIAVLPFINMSGDPKQEYFSDGLTEEIITALSKTPKMFVIAPNSTFSYKDQQVKIQQVAEQLGVRYVLEGSVRKSEERVRVTAQLIDAITGRHLWAERYDRDLKDIFALQDQITLKILNALQVKLTEGEAFSGTAKGTDNLEAYLKWLLSREYMRKYTKEGMAMGRKLAEEAIALDSDFPFPYLTVSATHIIDAMFGWCESPKHSLKLAEEMVQKALALDDGLGMGHSFLGRIHLTKRHYNKAISEGERAIVLAPNSDFCHAALAYTLNRVGRQEAAIGLYKKAIRLNPHAPGWYFSGLGSCYRMMGEYEKAVSEHKRNLQKIPTRLADHIALAATFSLMGREEDARAEAEEVLRLQPKFSVKHFVKQQMYRNQADTDRLVAALCKAGLPETPPLPLPDKPSIAVLPFVNMSADPKQEYFSDGITEEIITALSKTPKLFVIARTSSFKYKGKDVDVRTVGRELGVRYVLEGSVRRSEDQLRITAQLVDTKTGNHLWAERYDRELKHVFAVQDEITMRVINALQMELTEGEHARLWGKGTDNLQAYLKSWRARQYYLTGTRDDNELARRFAEEAIALDPEYAPPYHVLSITHFMDVLFRTTQSPEQSMKRAVELVQKAIALDDSYALAHGWLGFLYSWLRKHEKGIMEAQKCVALDPNGAHGYLYLNMVLRFAGRFEEAVQAIEKAIRLNPFPPNTYFRQACGTYVFVGRYEEAIAAGKKAVTASPNDFIAHMFLAAAYSLSGREEEAHAEAAEVLRISPKFFLKRFSKTIPFKNQADTDLLINALRKAGLK